MSLELSSRQKFLLKTEPYRVEKFWMFVTYTASNLIRNILTLRGCFHSEVYQWISLLRGEEQKKRRFPTLPKKCLEKVIKPFDDGWPEYDETFIDVQML